jgi:hypothetical protein
MGLRGVPEREHRAALADVGDGSYQDRCDAAVSPYVIGKDARFAALLKRMGFESNDQQKGYGS